MGSTNLWDEENCCIMFFVFDLTEIWECSARAVIIIPNKQPYCLPLRLTSDATSSPLQCRPALSLSTCVQLPLLSLLASTSPTNFAWRVADGRGISCFYHCVTSRFLSKKLKTLFEFVCKAVPLMSNDCHYSSRNSDSRHNTTDSHASFQTFPKKSGRPSQHPQQDTKPGRLVVWAQ